MHDAELEVVRQSRGEYLHVRAMLMRQSVLAEVYVILEVFYSDLYFSANMGDVEDTSDAVSALLAEVILPDKVV